MTSPMHEAGKREIMNDAHSGSDGMIAGARAPEAGSGTLKRSDRAWAIKWTSSNALDGLRQHFIGGAGNGPIYTRLFGTKREAAEELRARWGYIRKRPDLRAEPHGWTYPKVVRVIISVEEEPPQGTRAATSPPQKTDGASTMITPPESHP